MREPAFRSFTGRHRASAPGLILSFAPMLGLCGCSFNYLARSTLLGRIGLTPLRNHCSCARKYRNVRRRPEGSVVVVNPHLLLYPAARMFPGC